MNRFFLIFSIFFFFCLERSFAIEQEDRMEIDSVLQQWTNSWNNEAGVGLGKCYFEDADFVNIFGMHFHGSHEVEERHVNILQSFLQGSLFSVLSAQIREAAPDLVIVLVQWRLDGFYKPNQERSSPAEILYGRMTHVFIKNKGKWKITASQNTILGKP